MAHQTPALMASLVSAALPHVSASCLMKMCKVPFKMHEAELDAQG
jgi:hypothetical protein